MGLIITGFLDPFCAKRSTVFKWIRLVGQASSTLNGLLNIGINTNLQAIDVTLF